ncbi:hypothetical protein EHS25_005536 [Saitozyma podzolica]|uniref:Uncharacterized protein n=1 Tax=Saitozyma podzolica TaxID=1890683 RepID=A0A427XXU5_9TREE|nr:hypothetical protein EHS25_005536 [Saitozyma podzolica]
MFSAKSPQEFPGIIKHTAQVIPLGIKHVTKVIPPLVNRGQQPPSSPAIFPTRLPFALHIHIDNPALFPAHHTTSSPALSSTQHRSSSLASSTSQRSSHLASNTPQSFSRLASQTRSQVYVDHGYGRDGMDLDPMPDEASQNGSRRSEGGSVWIPSVHSEASGTPTSPSSPSTAPSSPTCPSPTPSSPPPSSPTPLSPALLAVLEEEPFHVNDPSGSSPPPGQDVRDQSFMDQFKLLMDLDLGDDILADLDLQPIDVDRGVGHHYENHTQPITEDQPSIGTSCWRAQHISYSNFQASLGNVHLPTNVFIHCLIAAGCDTIRLKAYGQKMPMTDGFLHNEPAQTDHRWAEHNEWDIGTSFASPYIWLFASATGRRHGIKHFPMLVPGSCDYGTVNLRQSHRGRHFSIKIYPRLVHVIKSFNSHLQGGIPRTLRGARNQVEAALRMIHSLTGRDGMGLGGFRIEVTVKAPSLRPHSRLPISAKLVEREAFLENANWVYQQAVVGNIFRGQAGDKPSKQQVQALTLNGLGWNGGISSPTRSLAAHAWWNLSPDAAPTLFNNLSEIHQTDDQIRELFQLARANSTGDGLPCKAHPNHQHHRYQVNNGQPFRIRPQQSPTEAPSSGHFSSAEELTAAFQTFKPDTSSMRDTFI